MATTLEPLSSAAARTLSEQATLGDFWRSSAPAEIHSPDQWLVWVRHLGGRRKPRPLSTLFQSSKSPLNWGLSIEQLSSIAVEMLAAVDRLCTKSKKKRQFDCAGAIQVLSTWLSRTGGMTQSAGIALECLAAAHLLPAIAHEANEELWWRVLEELWQIAQSAAEWRAEADLPGNDALTQQLLAGELPLTLAYFFPEIRPIYKLRVSAVEAISEGLIELTNGEGLLRGASLGVYRPLLASWTRSHAIGRQLKKGCCSTEAAEQFDYLPTQALVLSAPNGTALLGAPYDDVWDPDFLAAVVRIGGSWHAAAARQMFPKKLTREVSSKTDRRTPLVSDDCEWSGVCVMRAAWDPRSATVAVDYSTPQLRLEVWSEAEKLFEGVWDSETFVDGNRLEPSGEWENICWFTDHEADYLELSLKMTGGARLERQLLLARNDQFLYLVDNIHLHQTSDIAHRLRLPLTADVDFQPADETREGLLIGDKLTARVLPLALPEWRSDPRIGQLSVRARKLELEMQRSGQNLSCPLFIDLRRTRASKPCTWRQLTVGESLQILPHDVAVGYRAQCGKAQWLFYRSLGPRANRTLLGQNTSSEFLVARFLAPSGKIQELVEIDGY